MAHSQIPVPINVQTGRIQDFVNGWKESEDQKTKAMLLTFGILAAPKAWSAYKAMRDK
jgi:hypothetical protein